MPLYEYVCRDCGHEFEALQRLSDPLLTDCPACQASALQKKVSAAGFRLAGSGWYETDFKSTGKRNLAGDSNGSGDGSGKGEAKSGDAKSGDAKSGDTKSDAKPAAKSDAKSGSEAKPASKSSGDSATKSTSSGSAGAA